MKPVKSIKPAHTTACILLAVLLIPVLSIGQGANNKEKNKNGKIMMSTIQRNKEAVQKLYDEALNNRKMELLRDLVSDDYVGIRGVKGAAGFEEPIAALIKGFPDMQWKIEALIGEGDKVFVKWRVKGTHTGQFVSLAATGKVASNEGMAIYELKEGKIISGQVLTDRLGFLQQLAVLPLDITVLYNRKARQGQVNFIDKFFVPAAAKTAFYERMNINRRFIKKLPGFIEDAAYEYNDHDGNLICVTVALWESQEALNNAKEAVQAEYKKQGFDGAEMFKRLNIIVDRGVYTQLVEE